MLSVTRLRRGAVVAALALAVGWASCVKQTVVHDADVLREQGDTEQAGKLYREALARDPKDAAAHFGLAEVLAEGGDPSGADTHFTQAERLRPDWAGRVTEARARHATRFAREALALGEQGRAPEAAPKLSAAEILSPDLAETAFVRGRLAEARGDTLAAAGHYRAAHAKDPGDERFRQALLSVLVEAGRVARDEGRFEDARRDLEEAAALDPGPEIRYLLGSVAFDLAERSTGEARDRLLDEAAAAFREVIRVRPDDRDASYNLGAVLLAARRFEEAAAWHLQLIASEPRDPELYLALSVAHSQLDRIEEGRVEEAIGRALRANHPVDDPAGWARRSAARFPQSDLSRTFARDGAPQEVQTYQRQEGGLVEVWFYWDRGSATAFRDGGRVGAEFRLPRP